MRLRTSVSSDVIGPGHEAIRKLGFCSIFAAMLAICLFGFSKSMAGQLNTYNESIDALTAQQYQNGIIRVIGRNDTIRIQVVSENPWKSKYNSSFTFSLLGEPDWEYDWGPFMQHFRKIVSFSSHNPNREVGLYLSAGKENLLAGFVNKFLTTENWLKSAELLNQSKEIVHESGNFVSSVIGISDLELPLSSKTESHNPFTGLSAEGRVKATQNVEKLPNLHNEPLSNASASANKPESPGLERERFGQVQLAEEKENSHLKNVRPVTVLPTTIGRIISLFDDGDVAKLQSTGGKLTIAGDFSSMENAGRLLPSQLISENGLKLAQKSNSTIGNNELTNQKQVIADQVHAAVHGEEFRSNWPDYPYAGMQLANSEMGLNSDSILNRNAYSLPDTTDSSEPIDENGKTNLHSLVQASNHKHGPRSGILNQSRKDLVQEQLQQILEFYNSEIQSQCHTGFADSYFIQNRDNPFLLQYLKKAMESIPIPHNSGIDLQSEFSREFWNLLNKRTPYNEYTRDLADTITIEH